MICVWEQKHFPQTPDNSNIFLLAVFVAVIQFFCVSLLSDKYI